MVMKSGRRWHCVNPACRCVVLVEITGEIQGQNPRCVCGSAMKMQYSSPVFQYLDFLRFPEPVFTRGDSRKD